MSAGSGVDHGGGELLSPVTGVACCQGPEMRLREQLEHDWGSLGGDEHRAGWGCGGIWSRAQCGDLGQEGRRCTRRGKRGFWTDVKLSWWVKLASGRGKGGVLRKHIWVASPSFLRTPYFLPLSWHPLWEVPWSLSGDTSEDTGKLPGAELGQGAGCFWVLGPWTCPLT